jgi:hypothetical protein
MHPAFWLLLGVIGLIVAYGILQTAYRFVRGTVSDTLLLAVMAGVAMFAAYVFG